MTIHEDFPNLQASRYQKTSEYDPGYNCIAWACARSDVWYEPDAMGIYPWPGEIRNLTLAALVNLFQKHGYTSCESVAYEEGFEKVALYGINGFYTHAARQLNKDQWTSKLGAEIDIAHTIAGVEGPLYGKHLLTMRRPKANPAS